MLLSRFDIKLLEVGFDHDLFHAFVTGLNRISQRLQL